MKRLTASSTRKKTTQRGESQNLGRCGGVGDDPRCAGGGDSAGRSSACWAIVLGYSARHAPPATRAAVRRALVPPISSDHRPVDRAAGRCRIGRCTAILDGAINDTEGKPMRAILAMSVAVLALAAVGAAA